jgi:hypothetical protein
MKAAIECLDISVDGPLATKLYNSSKGETNNGGNEDDFVRDLLYEPSPPAFKIRVVSCNLSLDDLNQKSAENQTDCGFGVQIAAAHNLGQQIATETAASLVFRYRGSCSSDTEVSKKGNALLICRLNKCPTGLAEENDFAPNHACQRPAAFVDCLEA